MKEEPERDFVKSEDYDGREDEHPEELEEDDASNPAFPSNENYFSKEYSNEDSVPDSFQEKFSSEKSPFLSREQPWSQEELPEEQEEEEEEEDPQEDSYENENENEEENYPEEQDEEQEEPENEDYQDETSASNNWQNTENTNDSSRSPVVDNYRHNNNSNHEDARSSSSPPTATAPAPFNRIAFVRICITSAKSTCTIKASLLQQFSKTLVYIIVSSCLDLTFALFLILITINDHY